MLRRDEFVKIIEYLVAVYPEMEKIFNVETTQAVWYDLLKDIEYQDLTLAVKAYCSTERFSPKPADLRRLTVKTTTADNDWSEGWSLVLRSIQKYGMYQEGEALDWIGDRDAIAAEAIRRLSYKNLCLAEDQMAFRANFRKVYEAQKDQKTFIKKLQPEARKRLLENKEKAKRKLIELNPGAEDNLDDLDDYLDAIGGGE